MKTQRWVTGALLALAAAAAQAVTVELSAGPYSANVDKTGSTFFTDVYNFSFAGVSGIVSGSIMGYRLLKAIDIDWADSPAVAIHGGWDGSGALLASFADRCERSIGFAIEDVAVPNHFSITVSGRAIGSGTSHFQPGLRGSYDISVAAQPVPEPQAWALTMAGLLVVGFLGVRRRSER
jgi:hypothetical protein